MAPISNRQKRTSCYCSDVNKTEHQASDALPLALAAARLGISSDALRMRINRGKIRGFKKGGRLFAVLDEAPRQPQRTARVGTEQTAPGEPSLPLVVEFQKVELSRLMRDNSRLNQRLDQLFEELRHLREMQQREQVLRQQEQALRQRSQDLIERLSAPPALAPRKSLIPDPKPPMFARSMPPVTDPPAPAPRAPGPPHPAPRWRDPNLRRRPPAPGLRRWRWGPRAWRRSMFPALARPKREARATLPMGSNKRPRRRPHRHPR